MGNNGFLRTITSTSAVIFSGAKALAGTAPAIGRVITFDRCSRGSLLHVTTYLRRRFPRSVTGTIMSTTGRERLSRRRVRSGMRCIITRKVSSSVSSGGILVKDDRFVFRSRKYAVPSRCRSECSSLGPRCSRLCLTVRGRLITIVYVRSPLHRRTTRVIHGLGGTNVHGVIVVANSDRHATTTVTGHINISRCCTRILPRSGTGFIRGRGTRKEGMVVVNSKVGSSPTLSTTSTKVTVDSNTRVTERVTSVAVTTSSLHRIIALGLLTGTVVGQVRGGCEGVIKVGSKLVLLNIAKVIRPAMSTLLRGTSALVVDLKDVGGLLSRGGEARRRWNEGYQSRLLWELGPTIL